MSIKNIVTNLAPDSRRTKQRDETLWDLFEERLAHLDRSAGDYCTFDIVLPNGRSRTFGGGQALFTLSTRDRAGWEAMASFNEMSIAEAYLGGHIDIDGSPLEYLKYRDILADSNAVGYFWTNYLRPRVLGQVSGDKKFIGSHYDEPPEFFELWLDKRIRGYSHGFFDDDDESLEAGMVRKFQYAIDAVGAKEGSRILDIGGGWGSFVQYAGEQGIHVTSITISEESKSYVQNLIRERGLSHCKIIKEHLFDFHSSELFDGIVNLGVTEHLPDYARTIDKYRELLVPGGRVYLDSYSGVKYGMSSFVMKWVFQSNTSPWCLHEYLKVLATTDMELIYLQNDRHNYFLTCKKWAENLEACRAEVVRRWGEFLYRRFHLYLWSAAAAFQDGLLGAHRGVLHYVPEQSGRRQRSLYGRRGRSS